LSYLALVIRWIASLLLLLWQIGHPTRPWVSRSPLQVFAPWVILNRMYSEGHQLCSHFFPFKYSIPTLQKVLYSGSMSEASGLVSE